MSDYKVIFTSAFHAVTEVRLYDETIQHVKDNHKEVPIELPCISSAVEKGIAQPTHIEESYSNSLIYVDSETTDHRGQPLRIPVKIIDGTTSARVKTVLFAEGNSEPNVIWRKP